MSIGVTKVLDSFYDAYQRLRVKVLYKGAIKDGKGDIRTPLEASPFGVDSRPINGKIGIFARGDAYGKYYLIGYLNTKRKAEPGELRLFATDDAGEEQGYTWLKKSGILELLGDDNNAVKYNELKAEYDKTKAYLSALKTATRALAVALDGIAPGTSAAFDAAMALQVLGDFGLTKNYRIKTNS